VPASPIKLPVTDPQPIFDAYRGIYETALLTSAVSDFKLFAELALKPVNDAQLQAALQMQSRPFQVLIVAMRAMGFVQRDISGLNHLSAVAREHLVGGEFDISDYVSQAADNPAVREITKRLRSNKPAGAEPDEQGVGWIYREGVHSAMDQEAAARKLTLALAGRAKNVAPVLAERVPLAQATKLLDIGGGTGIYSIACVKRHPHLRAVVWDRPEVLKVAREFAEAAGVADRVELVAGDMFTDAPPAGCDVYLLSNILHDWDVPECKKIIDRLATALPDGGRLMIHDALLNDEMYSANLFCLTEGRCYSGAEYRGWLKGAGLDVQNSPIPTLAACSVVIGTR
jgi:precorrin-6B methylase 2